MLPRESSPLRISRAVGIHCAISASGLLDGNAGAIELLLCAVVLDGMTGTKHANSELTGRGLGNMVAFCGITATAAIARSAANVRWRDLSPSRR